MLLKAPKWRCHPKTPLAVVSTRTHLGWSRVAQDHPFLHDHLAHHNNDLRGTLIHDEVGFLVIYLIRMTLPLPGSPASSWAMFRERLRLSFSGADPRVCVAFWLFGTCSASSSMNVVGPLTVAKRSDRLDQQCPLRDHSLCGPRSGRTRRTQRRCPPCRCHSLFLHQTMRTLLHPSGTILDSNYHLRAIVGNGHAPYRPHPSLH